MPVNEKYLATPVKVDIPFSNDEAAEFRRFIRDTGRKQGTWVRMIILEAMAKEANAKAGAA